MRRIEKAFWIKKADGREKNLKNANKHEKSVTMIKEQMPYKGDQN